VAGKDTVSWSELSTWCECRQKWFWCYETGIVPIRVSRPPTLGACVHVGLAAAMKGIAWEIEMDTWKQKEVEKRQLFDEDIALFDEVLQTAKVIVAGYVQHYLDDWTPVVVEQKFEAVIPDIGVKLIGYWDSIVQTKDGQTWVLEHKCPKIFRSEDMIDLDGQILTYQYAALRSGYQAVGTIYDQLLAKVPSVPTLNKNGTMSRTAINTTWEVYEKTLLENGLNPAEYDDMRVKLAENTFFKRMYIYRSQEHVKAYSKELAKKIWDMRRKKKHIYKSESVFNCGKCPYAELCLEQARGRDISYIIENNFQPKPTREDDASNGSNEGSEA